MNYVILFLSIALIVWGVWYYGELERKAQQRKLFDALAEAVNKLWWSRKTAGRLCAQLDQMVTAHAEAQSEIHDLHQALAPYSDPKVYISERWAPWFAIQRLKANRITNHQFQFKTYATSFSVARDAEIPLSLVIDRMCQEFRKGLEQEIK